MNKSIQRDVISTVINNLAEQIHETAKEKGWWDTERSDGECIALMHSELSECLEALRHNNPVDEHISAHENAVVELADCIIRILDYCEHKRLCVSKHEDRIPWDIGTALYDKMEYNKTREYKHGGKKF